MRGNNKKIVILFMLFIFALFHLDFVFASGNISYYFLKKETAKEFFGNIIENYGKSDEYRLHKEYIEKNDLLGLLDGVDYFCWGKINRDYRVLIPDIAQKELNDRLGDDLIKKKENSNSHLITKKKMYAYSLKLLIEEQDPGPYENLIKCRQIPYNLNENMIAFDIIKFPEDGENSLKIYSCFKINDNKYEFYKYRKSLPLNKFRDCINMWKSMLNPESKDSINKKNVLTEIKVRIAAIIGGINIYKICEGEPIRIKYGNFTVKTYTQVDQILEKTEIPNVPIEFDLTNEDDINKISAESIYFSDGNKFKVISYNSLYADIWDYYNNTINKVFIDNTVNLLYVRTSNFEPDESNANVLSKELKDIKELIEKIVKNRSRDTKIKVIGYADNPGTEKRNRELSLERAESVREWLIKNITNSKGKIIFLDPSGCNEKFYTEPNFKDRSVEIKIY